MSQASYHCSKPHLNSSKLEEDSQEAIAFARPTRGNGSEAESPKMP